jgi:hypothetical protein
VKGIIQKIAPCARQQKHLIMSFLNITKETKVKTKIKKIKSSSDFTERLNGVGTFRITGPSAKDGKRITINFNGTRAQAEKVAASPLVLEHGV